MYSGLYRRARTCPQILCGIFPSLSLILIFPDEKASPRSVMREPSARELRETFWINDFSRVPPLHFDGRNVQPTTNLSSNLPARSSVFVSRGLIYRLAPSSARTCTSLDDSRAPMQPSVAVIHLVSLSRYRARVMSEFRYSRRSLRDRNEIISSLFLPHPLRLIDALAR